MVGGVWGGPKTKEENPGKRKYGILGEFWGFYGNFLGIFGKCRDFVGIIEGFYGDFR